MGSKGRKRKPVRTARFTPGTYRVLFEQLDGITIQPDAWFNEKPELSITIRADLEGQDRLETIIHEAMHAEWPTMREKRVKAGARNIARLLWRLGYRDR